MVNHRVSVIREFELNGHSGFITWNDNTQWHSLVCDTCNGQPGGGLLLTRWRRNIRRLQHEMVWQQHADPLNHPVKGQRYSWQGMAYTVTRVSENARWADIRVEGEGGWTKRQPLPLPPGSTLIPGGA